MGRQSDFLVIGLGRFGGGLAETLAALGHDVLGVDSDPRALRAYRSLTHTVEADSTDVTAMRRLGAAEFPTAVVAIGSDVEASILTTALLSDLGVARIVAKAVSEPQAKILDRVGATRVVFPERDMGIRLAHSLVGSTIDFVELDPGFALAETTAPVELAGMTPAEAHVRRRYGITVVCIKPQGGAFTYATQDMVVHPGDILVVAGDTHAVEAFGELQMCELTA